MYDYLETFTATFCGLVVMAAVVLSPLIFCGIIAYALMAK